MAVPYNIPLKILYSAFTMLPTHAGLTVQYFMPFDILSQMCPSASTCGSSSNKKQCLLDAHIPHH